MYYDQCVRNYSDLSVSSLLKDFKEGRTNELVIDIRDNFLYCGINYGLANTYVSLRDHVLVTKYGSSYFIIDCYECVPGYNIYDFLNGNITFHELLVKRNHMNVYGGEIIWDGIRPKLRIAR